MAAAVQQFDGWLRASQRVRAAFRERPKTAVGILAMASMLVAFIAAWMVQTSNPLYRAERALASGRAEAALRHLEGVTNSAKAGFLRGRALYSLKRASEGIAQYKEASLTEPEVLAHKEVLSDLAQSLGGRQSQDAVELLVQAGEPAVELLVDASRDTQNSRRRWAAIEGLRRMKHEDRVDLVAAYLLDIKSRDCAVVTKAAKSLGELGDKRAVQPLREIAQRKSLVFDACEAPAARAALRRLEKK